MSSTPKEFRPEEDIKSPLGMNGAPQILERQVAQIAINCFERFLEDGTVIHREVRTNLYGECFEEGKTARGLREGYAWISLAEGAIVNAIVGAAAEPQEDKVRVIIPPAGLKIQ